MKPQEARQKYNESIAELETQYLQDIIPWILAIKPGAKQFEFEGYQEGDDEGGSYYCFSSLFIDEDNLEDLVEAMPLEKITELFNVSFSEYRTEESLGKDEYETWDWVREYLEFPEFVYSYSATEIPQE